MTRRRWSFYGRLPRRPSASFRWMTRIESRGEQKSASQCRRSTHGERLLLCDRAVASRGPVVDLTGATSERWRTKDSPRPRCRSCRQLGANSPAPSVPCVLQDSKEPPGEIGWRPCNCNRRSSRPWSGSGQRRAPTQGSSQPIARPITTSPSRSRRWPRATTS